MLDSLVTLDLPALLHDPLAHIMDRSRPHSLPLNRHAGSIGRQKKKTSWIVLLGETEWSKFTYTRLGDIPFKLLGSVKYGAQMGALASTPEGGYVQVVGDYVQSLPSGKVAFALAKAKAKDPNETYLRSQRPTVVPKVIVKRRRTFVYE